MALALALAMAVAPAPALAGSYDVVSCGALGAGGREIRIQQRPRVDRAVYRPVGTVTSGRRGEFRVRVPAGASRVVRVTSPGTGGLQAGLRTLRVGVRWSSSLAVSPRSPLRGGRIRLSVSVPPRETRGTCGRGH